MDWVLTRSYCTSVSPPPVTWSRLGLDFSNDSVFHLGLDSVSTRPKSQNLEAGLDSSKPRRQFKSLVLTRTRYRWSRPRRRSQNAQESFKLHHNHPKIDTIMKFSLLLSPKRPLSWVCKSHVFITASQVAHLLRRKHAEFASDL